MATDFSKLTLSVHAGSEGDPRFGGMATPLYPSSAYDYLHTEEGSIYPRYYNTPNQKAVVTKLAALEGAEDGVFFSSGLAAILTSVLSFMEHGEHAIFQRDLYGGTFNAVTLEMQRFGMEFSFVESTDPDAFRKAIRSNTRVIYIETPSNPTLRITPIRAVAEIARKHELISIIDNTFASPINQNPTLLGVDIVTHSGTKYIGGHNDAICGVALGKAEHVARIRKHAMNYGGNADAYTAWLVERSLKTLALRVRQQNANAMAIASFLQQESRIGKVFYPGLATHSGHDIAKEQMTGGFGGMLSFEVPGDPDEFMNRLKLIARAISLGGVQTTITSPARTSHSKLTADERKQMEVSDSLLRLSVGIEEAGDLIEDIRQALH